MRAALHSTAGLSPTMSGSLHALSRRRLLLLASALVLLTGAYACRYAGAFLARADPLARADAIFVFAGTRVERPLEAADLYHEGWAPQIVLTRAASEQEAIAAAAAKGARLTTELDASIEMLEALGIPPERLIVPERAHDNTAEEAATLRELALAGGWTRVIAVSSQYHLRRVAVACRRALRGTDVAVVVRGTRYDASTPDRWWQRRADIRWLASELPKLAAYALGAAD